LYLRVKILESWKKEDGLLVWNHDLGKIKWELSEPDLGRLKGFGGNKSGAGFGEVKKDMRKII
jgi:hypothetical protein